MQKWFLLIFCCLLIIVTQIYFEATRGSSYRSDIALDNVKLEQGSCGEFTH